MDKIKQLENIAKVLGTYNVITKDEFNQVIKSVADVLKVERENIKGISEEYKQTLQSVIDTISEEHDKVLQSVENTSQTAKSEATEAITKALEEVKRIAKEVMEMKPKDGERGLDADEEIIVEKVLGKIVLPEYKETVLDGGEQIVDKINALDLSPENQIDASHIKNLPQPKMIGGGSTARNLYQLNDVNISSPTSNQVLKYNSTTNLWENGSGGGGSGDVVGPASASDNAIARYDGTTGKLIQDSSIGITDAGFLGIGTLTPQRALTIQDSTFSSTLMAFYNPNTSDGTSNFWSARTDTTGAGAATFQSLGTLGFNFDTHDHATRQASLIVQLSKASGPTTRYKFNYEGLYIGGSAASTALLHLAAGTTAAGTAPIKLTTGGSLLTTPEAGAVESTDTHVYWTDNAGSRHQLDQQGGGGAAWGSITGTLSDQTDLQTALNAKQALDTQLTSLAGLAYTGNAGKFIRVNAGETDFELATVSATPGGADTQVQFNDGGAFGGDSGFVFNKTNDTLNIGGATLTTSDPILDLTQTWNSAGVTFTGLKTNITSTASAAASLLMDIQEGGSTKFAVGKTGITQALRYTNIGAGSLGGMDFSAGWTRLLGYDGKASISVSTATGIPNMLYGISFGSNYFTPDTYIDRDASGALAQRASTTSQSFRVYKTYTDASNYERLSLNGTATSNWLQLAAETAGTGGDNLNLALTPSGTGAISAQVPDSTTAGGNARGTYSTDWQRNRSGAIQVASGSRSTLSGGENNTASANYSTIGGGSNNVASGTYSFIGGGDNNTASGSYSYVSGGLYGTTRGLIGAFAYANGRFAATGDAQKIGQVVRKATTNATPTVLTADAGAAGATNIMVLPNSSVYGFTAKVWAISGSNAGYWEVRGTMYRGANAAATALIGTTTVQAFGVSAALSTAVVDVIADTTNGGAVIQVTGIAATNINWGGELSGGQGI